MPATYLVCHVKMKITFCDVDDDVQNHMWMILIRSGSGDGSDSTYKLVRLNGPNIGLDPLCRNCSSIDSFAVSLFVNMKVEKYKVGQKDHCHCLEIHFPGLHTRCYHLIALEYFFLFFLYGEAVISEKFSLCKHFQWGEGAQKRQICGLEEVYTGQHLQFLNCNVY